MDQRLVRVETAVNAFEKKLDQLATKADFTMLKNDFETLANKVASLLEDARDTVKKAAEGYKATLDRIETDLGDLNKKVDVRFADHDKVLANHNARITVLEAPASPRG
jgi:predicted  nucleic acid-binding Zn-ribbon protein